MKALKLIVIGMMFCAGAAQAQVAVNVNIGAPPPWGPAGYNDVGYYYLPDVQAYYDVHASMFIYYDGGVWVHRATLPGQYRSYDLYGGYKVPMTGYRGNTPYTNFKEYRTKYAKGYRGGAQRTVAERPVKGREPARANEKGAEHANERGEDHGHENGEGERK